MNHFASTRELFIKTPIANEITEGNARMRIFSSSGLFAATMTCSLMLLGCGGGGGDGPKTARVSGTVTLQGKPLVGVNVYFSSEKFSSYGKTNAEGHYELVQGAVPGNNKVYISKLELPEGVNTDPESGLDLAQFQAAAAGNENDPNGKKKASLTDVVPEEFSNPQKSKLTFPVPPEGTTSADFRL